MIARPYQICTRCVMDTSDPFISFDGEGRCNLCTDFLENRLTVMVSSEKNGQSLEALFDTVRKRGRGRKYDCVIGVSGGVDSSYTCLLAARHGLRALAVHLDNGWNSPIAVKNIRNVVSRLGIDYASYVLPWTDFRKVQLAFLKASVPEAETPTDVAIQRAVHHHALKHRVPTVLSGGNIAGEGILPVSWHYNGRDTRYSYAILDAANCPRKHFASQKFGALDEIYCKVIRGIRTLYPLNHVDYDKDSAKAEMEQDYGWQNYGAKHGESRYTRFIQSYYLVVKHGIDYRRATFSSEILIGRLSRETALAALEQPPFTEDIEAEIDFVCKKLAISRSEMDAIIASPPKYYVDYPNQSRQLGLLYDAYRAITGRKKTSNF